MKRNSTDLFKKVIFIVFCICFFANLLLVDRFNNLSGLFTDENFLNFYPFFNSKTTFILIYLLRFFTCGLTVAIFTSYNFNNSYFKKIVAYIGPVISILNIIFIKYNMIALLDADDKFYTFRLILSLLLFISMLVYSILNLISLKKENDLNTNKFVYSILLFILSCVLGDYSSTLELFWSKSGIVVQLANLGHLIIILFFVCLIVFFKIILKNKDTEFRRMILFAIAIGGLIKHFHYSQYVLSLSPFSLHGEAIPLNLCHIGIILLPIALLTKNRKVAVFTIINSVGGALAAFIIPSAAFGKTLTDTKTVHFIINHALLIILPYLMFDYKIFEKVTKKEIKPILLMDILYWFVVCIANAVLPNLSFLKGVSYFAGNPVTAAEFAAIIPGGSNMLNYCFKFNIGSWTFNIYYIWWIVLLGLSILVTALGYGAYQLVSVIKRKNRT